MGVIGELLFYRRDQVDLDAVLRNKVDAVRAVVDRLSDHEFATKKNDELAALVDKSERMTPLEVHFDKATPHVEEAQVDVQDQFGFEGGTVRVAGLMATKTIPFSGDSMLWSLRTNPYNLNPPRGVVRGQNLVIGITVRVQQADEAKRYIDDVIARLPEYLGWQRSQIETYNNGLTGRAMPRIQERRARLSQASDVLKKLQG
ncbi:hypothetical protein [Methylocapsa aurea]|uniref:hypothetical protein n=1 Tax=Methylocapsa aurea TaxID=663610 RepID=UPI0005695E5A|nr:hypothetical protein [Methylocapsa aurea]